MENDVTKKIKKYLNDTGKDVFISILYPALKRKCELTGTYDIDYIDVCQTYPEYAKRAESDKSKRTRLSKAKAILRNGWEREALTLIAESRRIDERLIKIAKEYLAGKRRESTGCDWVVCQGIMVCSPSRHMRRDGEQTYTAYGTLVWIMVVSG